MQKEFIIEKIKTNNGQLTLKVNNYFLHSKYDPIKEARMLAEKNYEIHHVHILFGYGLGYFAESLNEHFKYEEPFLVIDPLLDDLSIVVQEKHMENGLNTKCYNSEAIENLEYLINMIKKVAYQKKIKIICSPNYEKLFPEQYLQLLKKVKDIQEKNIVNENTINRDSEVWQKNLSLNLISIFEDCNLEKLHHQYTCPVIIASGGPSLTKQLPLLKENQNRVIIIAAGSTINSLLAVGIEPDYVTVIDGTLASYSHFKDLNLKKAKLLYNVSSHASIRECFETESYAFVAASSSNISNYLKKKLGIYLPEIIGGGSCAQYSYSLAQYMSRGPIALIGQDLAFTNNQTHADNNKQVTLIQEEWKNSDGVYTVEGYFGENVWTSTMFNTMKLKFEDMKKNYPPQNIVYNCTEGGVKLDGFDQKSFNEFCEEFITEEIYKENENNIEYKSVSQDDWLKMRKTLKEELISYKKIIDRLNKGITALINNKSEVHFSEKTLRKLEKVDSEIAKEFSNIQMDFIISPITNDVIKNYLEKENETQIEKYRRIFNQTKELYSRLIEVTRTSEGYTREVINRIKIEKLIREEEK